MRIFGLPIPFTGERKKDLSPVDANRGWWPLLREAATGNWQMNVEVRLENVLSFHADFACRTLIASDIAKLRLMLVKKDDKGIWTEASSNAFSPVLRKPNRFQTRIQFFESWVLSKLQRGNTYVLKQRDNRGVVTALYVLDPTLVTPLVSETGDIFYELRTDHLSGLTERLLVPAREIIHDRFNCFFHPLVGLSPIYASGLAAMQGMAIQNNSTKFFQNGSQPGGILTAPGALSEGTATRLKEYFETNFSGANRGKVAVVGDGLKYESLAQKAVDAQLIEQLKWTAEVVCGVYHVPAFMVGVGTQPNYNNVQSLTLQYYSQCLQKLIEDIEACLDEGLGMDGVTMGVEFDLDDLLRMDTATQFDVAQKAKGIATLDEQRYDIPPAAGPLTSRYCGA
jgi:HK97 family phage portal protein